MPAPPLHPPPNARPRIVLAEPGGEGRAARVDGLRACGFVVSAQTADGAEAAQLAVYYRPDLLLISSRVTGRGALDAIRAVHDQEPDVAIVLLACPGDDPALAPAAYRAGARGVVPVDAAPARVHAALHAVNAGHGIVPPDVLEELRPVAGHGFRPIAGPLSNREWEIVDLLIAGFSTHDIAARLVLTDATVRSHLKHMHRKLGVHSRAALVDAARELFAEGDPVSPRPD